MDGIGRSIEGLAGRIHLYWWITEGIVSMIPGSWTVVVSHGEGWSLFSAIPFGIGVSLIVFATITVITMIVLWFVPERCFIRGWPDVIRCQWIETQSSLTVPSTFFFYLKGESAAVREFGRVTQYFMPGGQRHEETEDGNYRQIAYLPHEIWFSVGDKKLIRPENVPDDRLDRGGRRYKNYFLSGIQCGGETINEIKKAGNGFVFARKWK